MKDDLPLKISSSPANDVWINGWDVTYSYQVLRNHKSALQYNFVCLSLSPCTYFFNLFIHIKERKNTNKKSSSFFSLKCFIIIIFLNVTYCSSGVFRFQLRSIAHHGIIDYIARMRWKTKYHSFIHSFCIHSFRRSINCMNYDLVYSTHTLLVIIIIITITIISATITRAINTLNLIVSYHKEFHCKFN